jgi:hypothetical protein
MSNSIVGTEHRTIVSKHFKQNALNDSQPGIASRLPTNYSNAGRSGGDSRLLNKNRSAYPGQLASRWNLKRSLEGTKMGNTISGGLDPGGVFTPSGQRTQSAVPRQSRSKPYNFRGAGATTFPSQEGLYGPHESQKTSDGQMSTLYKKHSAYLSGQPGTVEYAAPAMMKG